MREECETVDNCISKLTEIASCQSGILLSLHETPVIKGDSISEAKDTRLFIASFIEIGWFQAYAKLVIHTSEPSDSYF